MSVIYGSFFAALPRQNESACDAKSVSSGNDAEPFRHQLNVQLIAYPA